MVLGEKPSVVLGRRSVLRLASCLALWNGFLALPRVTAAKTSLFLGVTTSTENSGLLAHLVERFEADHDIRIRAVTAGSGAVLNLAARGDVDLVLVHAPDDERTFVESGYGIDRRAVMRNFFVIVGPASDPAGIRGAGDAKSAMTAIAESGALFLSRGDESGTHKAELHLWREAGVDPAGNRRGDGGASWYRESGSGQGATLNIAANTGAYALTDDATWATFGNRADLQTLFQRDEPSMRNVYSLIRVNPERHAELNAGDAIVFAGWLTSKAGQSAIKAFTSGGRSLFQPVDHLAG